MVKLMRGWWVQLRSRFLGPLALTRWERVVFKGALALILFIVGLQLGIAHGRWLAGYEDATAGEAIVLNQTPRGGISSGAVVATSPVRRVLPAMVAEALTVDCDEVSVAAALQTAQAFRDSAAGADAAGPVSLRAVYAQAAVAEEMRALRCLWFWGR